MNPYAPPQAPPPPAAREHAGYGSPTLLGALAFGLICADTATRWSVLFLDWSWMASIQQGLTPTGVVTAERLLGGFGMLTRLAAIVVFFVWLHRVARNVTALGLAGLEISPAMCIVWWFVPIASLFMPYQAMAQIATASDPEGRGTSPFYVLGWWLLYIGSGLIAIVRVVATLGQRHPSAADLPARLGLTAISYVATTACLVALFFTMRFIDRGQRYWASQPVQA